MPFQPGHKFGRPKKPPLLRNDPHKMRLIRCRVHERLIEMLVGKVTTAPFYDKYADKIYFPAGTTLCASKLRDIPFKMLIFIPLEDEYEMAISRYYYNEYLNKLDKHVY